MYTKKNVMPNSFFPFVAWAYAPYKWWVLLFFVFCVIAGLYGVIGSYLLKTLVDLLGGLEGQQVHAMDIFWPIGLYLLNYETYYLSWRGIYYVNLKILPRVKNRIVSAFFDRIMQQSATFFQNNLSGSISNNIHVFVSNIEKIVYYPLYTVILGATQLVVSIIVMSSVNSIFSLGLFIWAVVFIAISLYFSRRVRVLSNGYAESNTQCYGKILDGIANVSSVRLYANRKYESSYLSLFLDIAKNKFRKKEYFLLKFSFCQGFSISALLLFVTFWLIRLKVNNEVSIGDFAFILTLVLDVVINVRTLTEQADIINDAIGQCRQSLQSIMVPIEVADAPGAKELEVKQGAIIFDNVSFEYRGSKILFKNKSIAISAGQKVGLVGYSGSGKSTFVHLILRLFDVDSGAITIDGQDIREVTQDSLRSQLGVIPQEFTLFHRTIMENIRYGRIEATDEEVIQASKRAHAHDFIMRFPKGYDTLVGEHGSKLSGGQRQRIALARVILKNAPILILDEATSQLDSLSEGEMQESFLQLMKDKTTIVVAHRLFTLTSMDRILVFQDGAVVEDGTHAELLRRGGLYRSIWHAQAGDIISDDVLRN
jgi:ATP-binding cassette subfamily B protein